MQNTNNVPSFFKDSTGRVVIAQWPNALLTGWALFKVLGMFIDTSRFKRGLEDLSTAILFTWAYQEITSGASKFRRLLGMVVMIALVVGYFNQN